MIDRRHIYLLFTITVLLASAGHTCGEKTSAVNPILVSIVSHNEEPRPGIRPDFVKNQDVFWEHRGAIVEFSRVLHGLGAAYNFQSDWNFLKAILAYDNGTNSTNGKNLLRYLREDLAFEIDPHAHESSHNYADVAFLIEQLGVNSSTIAGGFIAYPPEASKAEYFRDSIQGWVYNNSWRASALWGGGTSMHRNEEMLWASGIWRPRDNENFLRHDPYSSLPHIGGYKPDWSGLDLLLEQHELGQLDPDKIYTQTIFISQGELTVPGAIQDMISRIESLQKRAGGRIRWVGLGELMDIWRSEYDSEPNIHPFTPAQELEVSFFTRPVATNCTYYSTFQSHNQKVVQNENGIFMTHLVDYEDEPPWPGVWRLLRSIDGGETFQTIYTSPKVGSKAACIEADSENNILAVCGDDTQHDQPFLFHRFLASRDYAGPEITRIRHASSGKYSMMYDSGKVLLFNHYGKLLIINATTGRLISRKQVVKFSGENATTQYPHIYIDGKNMVHHAWTTVHKERYLYWDIHYINSPDGGLSWYRANRTRLSPPITPDHTGDSDQIILPDEFLHHTWLSSMIVKDGKVHLAYLAQKPEARQHYVRIDLLGGEIDHRIQPAWGGEMIKIRGLDGFFATGPGSSSLYYVGPANSSHLGVIVSHDNGLTWHDVALSPRLPDSIYSVGGFREITADDYIIGSFTNQYGKRGDPYFFKVKVSETILFKLLGLIHLVAVRRGLPY